MKPAYIKPQESLAQKLSISSRAGTLSLDLCIYSENDLGSLPSIKRKGNITAKRLKNVSVPKVCMLLEKVGNNKYRDQVGN